MLRSRGEHAVRLVCALGHQVVDEDADVRLVPSEDQRCLLASRESRVRTSNDALGSGLFIPRSPADLSGEVQAWELLDLERVFQRPRVHEVVLDVVPGAHDLHAREPLDAAQDLQLDLRREGPGQAVGVHDVGVKALRLQPDRVLLPMREPLDLLVQRRAIPRPAVAACDLRQGVGVLRDDRVRDGVGVRAPAHDEVVLHLDASFGVHETERLGRHVRCLGLKDVPVDGPPINPGRRSGLETAHVEL
mmetsp:Transcript_1089/g.2042  ORF Transcript_1089/g.2042 Transcript_1089/m.2042 type:complete len:247 (+) Transcript_1089:657-1397(+)